MKKITQLILIFLLFQFSVNAKQIEIRGLIINQENQPIPYAHISIENKTLGTVSNENGNFVFTFSDNHQNEIIVFSHIGHFAKKYPIKECMNKHLTIVLEKQMIVLSEIKVTPPNPQVILEQVIDKISNNYWPEPIILHGFYRETIKENERYTEYAEGIVDIYKTPLIIGAKKFTPDQLKLIKGRRKNDLNDYQIAKNPIVQIGGPVNCNYYDRMKYRPSFLKKSTIHKYDYQLTEATSINDDILYVISFDQKDSIQESLYSGKLFVDKSSQVVKRIEYGMSEKGKIYAMPKGLAKNMMKMFKMTFDDLSEVHIVDYQMVNGYWCIKSITQEDHLYMTRKGVKYDMEIKKNLIITKVNTENVKPFNKDEVLTNKEFKNQIGEYDEDFWSGYNYLLAPEEMIKRLKQANKN